MEFKWHIPGSISQNQENRSAITKHIFNTISNVLKNNGRGLLVFITFDELLTVSFPDKNLDLKAIDSIHQLVEDSLYFFKLDPFIPLNMKLKDKWRPII